MVEDPTYTVDWQQENTGDGGTAPFNQAAEYTCEQYPFRTWGGDIWPILRKPIWKPYVIV